MMKSYALLMAALSCTACTSLRVTEFDAADQTSRVGAPYRLPFTTYRIATTWQVVGCGERMKVSVTPVVGEVTAARDPLHRYTIDPDSLGSILKTSEVKLEYYPNGLVKSLNASAEDKTGNLIANIGSIATKIATFAAGGGAASGVRQEACAPETLSALEAVTAAKKLLAVATADVEIKTGALAALKEKVAQLGAAVDERTKSTFSTANEELASSLARQKGAMDALAGALSPITDHRVVQWPENGDIGRGTLVADRKVLRKWGRLDWNPVIGGESSAETAARALDVYFLLSPLATTGRPLNAVSPATGEPAHRRIGGDRIDPKLGIPFREPDSGWLRICGNNYCDSGGQTLTEHRGSGLQLGYIYYLPCKSRPFTSVNCSLELTKDGFLTTIGTAQKEAALVNASEALKGLVGDAATVSSTLANRKTALLEAKTKELKAEAEYRAAVLALREDSEAATMASTTTLTANVELAKARKAELKAEAELVATQAESGT